MWPLDPDGSFVVNGMVSSQIQVHDVASGNIFAGSIRNLCLDFTAPANGYVADELQKLNIVNFGTAANQTDVAAVEAWADDGDGVFDPQVDTRLGGLVFTGNRWELTALAEAVPLSGLRLFITTDLTAGATVGATIRLGLADDTDVAVGQHVQRLLHLIRGLEQIGELRVQLGEIVLDADFDQSLEPFGCQIVVALVFEGFGEHPARVGKVGILGADLLQQLDRARAIVMRQGSLQTR